MARANHTAGLAVGAAALALCGVSLAAWARWSASHVVDSARTDAAALADRVAGLLQTAVATARLRAEELAETPTVRGAVETDAAAVREMARAEGFVFTPGAHETIELFQLRRGHAPLSLMRVPEGARPLSLAHPEETRIEVRDGALTVMAAAAVDPLYAHGALKGSVAVATRLDLAPLAQSLAASGVVAELIGLDAPPLPLSAEAPAAGARVVNAPLALASAPSLAVRAAVRAGGGGALWAGRVALVAAFAMALWTFVEHRRRRELPNLDDAVTSRQETLPTDDDSAPTHRMEPLITSREKLRRDGGPLSLAWSQPMPTPITQLRPAWESVPIVVDPRGDLIASRYRLLQPLGRGSSADVYLAQSFVKSVAGTVALKLIGTVRPSDRDSFLAAARRQQRLTHPNIAQVYDVGSDEVGYVAMEYVEGCTLDALLLDLHARDEALPLPQTVAIIAAICRALDAATEARDERQARRPLVHGSIKPSNVLVGRHNAVKLADFGAPPSASDRHAPEQYAGKPPDRRSDVYAVGLILHELCTGRRVTPPASDAKQWPPLPAPSELRPGLLRVLDPIVAKATRFGPRVRYATAGELLADLLRATAHLVPAESSAWLADWVDRTRRSS
ncbi:MAG: masK16 [Myxococcales bacterium]|nr:masK16 [Myxococcales bacterium]